MNSRSIANASGNARAFRFLSYTLVFLMLACGVLSVSSLIRNVLPDWHSGLVAGIAFFVVIDRLYTYQHLKTLTPFSPEWGIALAAQWLFMALLIRFLLSYADGLDSLTRDLSLLARGDLENIFTPEFMITLLFALLVWSLTGQFLTLLDEIGLDLKWALSEETIFIQTDAVPAHQRLVNLIFSLGIGLVILTAVTRLDLPAAFSNPAGIPSLQWNRFSGAEAGALLYFVFGLALLSLSRLMSLQMHWNRLRIPVSSANLTRQWGIYSLIFLFILMVIISLLPAGDSLGFFSLLGTAFEFLFLVLYFIVQLVVMLVLILISLPFLLFGKGVYRPNLPSPPPLPPPPAQTAAPMDPSALLALLRSIFLWGALAAIIVFALIQFVRQHDTVLEALRRSRIANWLILAWQWLYRNADKTRLSLSQAIAEGWENLLARLEGTRSLPRPGWISLRSLDPRRRIYFFYLAMIRRGAEEGLTRRPSQTPSEYAVTLEKALPTVGEDIDSITEAFIQARYSRQIVDSSKAELVKTTWGRIRQALQNKSKDERPANH
jgi:hypothetical protein